MSLKRILKAESQKLGFNLCGITHPQTPPHFTFFSNWISRGNHAEMIYLEKPESLNFRANPTELFPDCKSIIVLGRTYSNPLQSPPLANSQGVIASYAWLDDYHNFLPEIITNLMEKIMKKSNISFAYRIFSDSAPILERDFAQLAGLGWIGKNSSLISPEFGSFFLLAEIFIDIEIEPDNPFDKDFCGKCRKCLEICPTKSLKDNRVLDSNTCISYLTIENKGEIPLGLRNRIGMNVFGCDLCQQVCPWNIKVNSKKQAEHINLNKSLSIPEILNDLQLTSQGFNKKFKNSPIKRAKRRGYIRNLCVIAGNTKNPVFVPVLIHLLSNDFESLIRGHAAWALGEIGTSEAFSSLSEQEILETDANVIKEIQLALSVIKLT